MYESILLAWEESILEGKENLTDEEFHALLLPLAAKMIMDTGNTSVAYLSKRFRIGYATAGRLIDAMEERGMLGKWDRQHQRNILISWQQFEEMFGPSETIGYTSEIQYALEQKQTEMIEIQRQYWKKIQEGNFMSYYYVIGVRMDNRISNASAFQQVLTQNGCKIKARLGLHEVSADLCATDGLIILQPYGEKAEIEQLVAELNALDGIKAKLIDLN
jgi:hypothetical protein